MMFADEGCDLEFIIPSKYLGALWCLGEYQLPQFFYHYRTDGTWKLSSFL